jgi:predicted PurR-regulated permease PerM
VGSTSQRAPSTARTLVALSIAGLALAAVLYASGVFFTILAGALLAIALRSPSEWICRRLGWPVGVSLVVGTILLLAATLAAIAVTGSYLGEQIQKLFEQIPQSFAAVRAQIAKIPWLSFLLRFGIRPTRPEVSPENVVVGATGILSGTFELGVSLIAVFFIGLYGAAQPRAYSSALLRIVPPEHRDRARDVLADVNHNLSAWLLGRLLAMASVAILTTAGLMIAGIPLPIPLGVVAGLFTFVEYLGAVVSAIPALLVALAQKPTDALWVLLVFTVAHVIEGYLLTPLITRGTVHFPPAFTLGFQLLFGAIFGVVGLTFATPVAVIGTVVVRKLYVEPRFGEREPSADRRAR